MSLVAMIAVQRFVPDAIVEIVRRQPVTAAKVDFAWRTAVGAVVARAATVSLDGDGTLVIHASDERWQREIQQSLGLVRARLEMLLGDALTRITFAAHRS